MAVESFGINHVAIEVDDIVKAKKFYKDVFNLKQYSGGEGDAFFKLGNHQFLAMFKVKKLNPDNHKHFGIMVRNNKQIKEIKKKLINKYKITPLKGFKCDFKDPFGNRIQVVDLHDESLVWLLPYQEVQKSGIKL